MFEPAGVALVSLPESLDTKTAAGRLFFQIIGSFAEFERERFKERVLPGMQKSAELGRWQGGRSAPYGYQYDPEGRRLVVEPQEAAVVRQIFAWYESGWSARRISLALSGLAIAAATKRGGQWNVSLIISILSNRVFLGELCWGVRTSRRTPSGGKRIVRVPMERVVRTPGAHEAIISQDQWERVAALRAERQKHRGRAAASPYLLSGVLRCGACGGPHHGWTVTGRRRRYIFAARRLGRCKAPSLRADPIENEVMGILASVTQAPDVADAVVRLVENQSAMEDPQIRREIAEGQTALERVAEKRKRAMEWEYESVLSPPQLREELARLGEEEARFRTRMKSLEARGEQRGKTAIGRERIFAILGDFPRVWGALTQEEQKVFVRSVVASVEVLGKGISRILCREGILGGLVVIRRSAQVTPRPKAHVCDMTVNGCPLAVVSYTNSRWEVEMRV